MGKKINNKSKNNLEITNKKELDNILNDLDWIDDYEKNNKGQKQNTNIKNKKKNQNKDNVNKKETNDKFDFQGVNSVSSNSDSEDCDNETNEKNNKFSEISNRFGFIESDSDSDDKLESDDKSEPDGELELDDELEQDDKLEKNNFIKTTNQKEIIIPIINDNIINEGTNNIEENLIEQKPKEKINMKKRQELQKEKKNKYNFELGVGKKNVLNTSNSSNHTLYSDNIEVIIGGKLLINSSDITINAGTKYFVLGQNGIGKTTLLKQIYSKLQSECDILMLDQDISIESSEQTINEFILGADMELYMCKKEMNLLEEKDELNDIETDEYNKLSELVYQKEWDKYEAESKRIINGLGFTNPETPVSILSGGKRMILALGKALLRKPEILVLDEPTNHLDLDVVIWLTNYLESYKKTLIVITHQIGLVNSVADIIWYIGNPELTGNKIYTIRGKYDKMLKFLEQVEKETNKNYEKFMKKIEEMRKKSIPKKDVEEYIKKEGIPRPPKPYVVNITFDNVIELPTKNIIEFKDVSFGYNDLNPIYKGLNITLGMGSRIVLVGYNGCGKTTFFKLANKNIIPTNGYVIADERLRVSYYNQQIIDSLPLNLTAIQYLQELNPKLDINQCRTILGKLGIKKHDNLDLPTNKISDLSGGQKARVSFASVQMSNPHLILLDEPTNHLDLESIEGLIKGINEFNGGIVVITHDIYLIESIERADIYQVKSSNIIKFQGDFEEYCNYIYSHEK